mmetsp:Transcript_66673/g.164334  ORF Transcript_66673/g.164334 Transcript_66673/m.164334 type:complete len:213 (-) Transcript_66673:12-650(-)
MATRFSTESLALRNTVVVPSPYLRLIFMHASAKSCSQMYPSMLASSSLLKSMNSFSVIVTPLDLIASLSSFSSRSPELSTSHVLKSSATSSFWRLARSCRPACRPSVGPIILSPVSGASRPVAAHPPHPQPRAWAPRLISAGRFVREAAWEVCAPLAIPGTPKLMEGAKACAPVAHAMAATAADLIIARRGFGGLPLAICSLARNGRTRNTA